MRPNKVTVALLFYAGICAAQQSISASGGNASGSGGTVSYSIGQAFYQTATGTSGSAAEGVQQPFEIQEVLGVEVPLKLSFSVYPNPAVEELHLDIGDFNTRNASYQLFDMNGRLLASNNLTQKLTSIGMDHYPVATYLLNVYTENKLLKTFKVVKKQ